MVMRSSVLLCTDVSPELVQSRKGTLERLGFSVIATTSSAVITVLESKDFPAVLIDCGSEGLDYEALTFDIKERFPQQLVVLLATCPDIPERLLWLADDYVMRGEPLQRLAQVIEGVNRARKKQAPSAAPRPFSTRIIAPSETDDSECAKVL